MEKILVIDNYDSFTYNLVHYIESIGTFKVDVFRNDKITLEEVANYQTIILSPGPGLPKDAGILLDIIKAYSATKKILGVCLGMQAIGQVFGANLENLETVLHGISTPIKILNHEKLFLNLPYSIEVGRYHSWVLSNDSFPKELLITSRDKKLQIMSIRHKQYDLYGVQFHPESIMTSLGFEIIKNFLKN